MIDHRDSSALTRYIAAGSVYTTPIVLHHLAQDADSAIRRRVAENPNIPPELVKLLRQDTNVDVRIALCENPAIAMTYVEIFVTDENPDVRFAIAENPLIPNDILLRLAVDENPYVAHRARKTYAKANPHAVAGELGHIAAATPHQRREVS